MIPLQQLASTHPEYGFFPLIGDPTIYRSRLLKLTLCISPEQKYLTIPIGKKRLTLADPAAHATFQELIVFLDRALQQAAKKD